VKQKEIRLHIRWQSDKMDIEENAFCRGDDMMPEKMAGNHQRFADMFIKNFIRAWDPDCIKVTARAWDPDFIKVTPQEAKKIADAENSGFVDESEIDWDNLSQY